MSLDDAARIARAVLYEGYLLYPYRASSAKNQQRWTFGVLVPHGFNATGERSGARTEVVYTGGVAEARLRFLQIVDEHAVIPSVSEGPGGVGRDAHACRPARPGPSLTLGMTDGVVEREVIASEDGSAVFRFGDLEGAITVRSEKHRVSVEIENLTPAHELSTREEALPLSMLSAHVVLTLRGGSFVSSIDPPQVWREHAASCRNDGLYPVLLADHCMLAAPIILYDYPKVAPESAGDLFDATEIDEILTLRILTLTEAEKDEIRRGDARGRELLERTEALTPEQRMLLHGAIREPR